MNPPIVRRLLAVVVVAGGLSSPGLAQSERVSPRVVPQPNQTVQIRTNSDMDVSVDVESAAPAGLAGPIHLISKNVMRVTQKSGARNDQGQITAELTVDELHNETLLNGQLLPVGNSITDLVGKTLTVVFDKDGGVVDATGTLGADVPDAVFKFMLTNLYSGMPATPIGIGETATVPIDRVLPIAIPGVGTMKSEGDATYTLVSIERKATGRFATFDITTNGKVVSSVPLSGGRQGLSWSVSMTGKGSATRELDRGLMSSSELQAEISGNMKPAGDSSTSPVPALAMHGTVKTTTTSGN